MKNIHVFFQNCERCTAQEKLSANPCPQIRAFVTSGFSFYLFNGQNLKLQKASWCQVMAYWKVNPSFTAIRKETKVATF